MLSVKCLRWIECEVFCRSKRNTEVLTVSQVRLGLDGFTVELRVINNGLKMTWRAQDPCKGFKRFNMQVQITCGMGLVFLKEEKNHSSH